MNFQSVLSRYAQSAPKLGPADRFPAEAMRADLQAVAKKNGRYFLAIFLVLTALMVLAVAVLAKFMDQPSKAVALLAASGVSIPFILRTMMQMWESKVKADALLAISSSLDDKLLRTVVVSWAHAAKP